MKYQISEVKFKIKVLYGIFDSLMDLGNTLKMDFKLLLNCKNIRQDFGIKN